ncbi:MAG TPA: hypothetical protein VN815_09740 [Steroidobacteraceae bacterium]|nr:hypothetical protein [Steroidobacteraceae bacterium]
MRTFSIAAAALLACIYSSAQAACPASATLQVQLPGSVICVMVEDSSLMKQQPLLRTWIERSAHIVADYYGQFPAPQVLVRLGGMDGSGIGGGRTTSDSGLMIQMRVGRASTAESLASDWVLVHEMVHLALPEVGRSHAWLAEGLATYVEGVARAQYGNRDIADVWAEDRHSMPMGLPREGEGGMDQSPTWGRTYWGGALFCLQADVAIREQTANRIGLQTALRAILRETGGYANDADIAEVMRIGDAATGTHVMLGLYNQIRTTPQKPNLDLLWTLLGVPNDPKAQPFDDHAPLAAIRIAITAKPAAATGASALKN